MERQLLLEAGLLPAAEYVCGSYLRNVAQAYSFQVR